MSPRGSVTMDKRITVLVVDDHALVRDGLRAVLATAPDVEVIGEAASIAAALSALRVRVADVVLLDLVLKTEDGLELLRQIRAAHPGVHVIALTSFGDEGRVRAAIEAGAMGFLLKDVRRNDLLQAIRNASQGLPTLHPEAQRHLMRRARGQADDPIASLTPRERSVLALVARGYNNGAIAAELGLTTGTVKVNVSRVLSKLGVDDRTKAALMALRAGFVMLEPDP